MTFEEAKKILEKEFAVINLHKSTESFEFDESGWIEHEKPSVLEAFRVLSKEGYYITISGHDYDMRKKRLKKEYEENTKAPGSTENSIKGDLSGNKSIEHCGEPIPGSPLSAVEGIKLKWKDNQNTSENPALAESASQFNDALLDEQAKKIEKLAYENERLKDQIVVLDACKKHNDKIDRLQIKRLGKEIAKLNGIIHDKNAVLSDVAEELRLSKIREKNLVEVSQKYMKENEELKKNLADKVVVKIDAQALKSAESALAYKDEAIETLDQELAEAKHELSSLKRPFRPDSTEAVVLFANAYAKAEKKHLRCAEWRNDGKEVSITYILKNGKKSKITLDFTGDEIIFSRTDPDKKPRIHTPELSEEELMKLQEKVCVDIAEEGEDHSGVIVLCGKDFIDAIKKMK